MKTKLIRVILFFTVVLIIPFFTLFGEKEKVSYNENKVLAEFPEFSFAGYKSRSFMNGVSDFFSDHFVLRETFIKAKNSIEKAIGKTEINGVIEINGNLIQTFRDVDYKLTDKNLIALNKLKAKNTDTPFYFIPVITAQEKMESEIPSYLAVESEKDYIDYCFGKLKEINSVDVSDAVISTEYAFYRTDHHWTTESAFNSYCVVADALGFTPKSKDFFSIETVADDFNGTLYSKTLNEKIDPDSIEFYRSSTDFTLTVKNETYSSLYFKDWLKEKDKYSFFLNGNHGVCRIGNKSANGKLLVIKDSYANCLLPFLAEHYGEITVVDPRYCNHSQIKDICVADFDAVITLFNVSGFSQEQNFSLIEFMGGK